MFVTCALFVATHEEVSAHQYITCTFLGITFSFFYFLWKDLCNPPLNFGNLQNSKFVQIQFVGLVHIVSSNKNFSGVTYFMC